MKTATLLLILLLPMAGMTQRWHAEIITTPNGKDSIIYVIDKDPMIFRVASMNTLFGMCVPEKAIIFVIDSMKCYKLTKPCTPLYTMRKCLDEKPKPRAEPWDYKIGLGRAGSRNYKTISTPKPHNQFAETLSTLWHEYRTECEHDSDKSRGAMMINDFPQFMKWIDKLNKK